MYSLQVSALDYGCCVALLVVNQVPLATLISATKPPLGPLNSAILSPEGLKRYFVVHGGLFSKDGVTLEDIRKIDRIGRQPGQEGLMCTYYACMPVTTFQR